MLDFCGVILFHDFIEKTKRTVYTRVTWRKTKISCKLDRNPTNLRNASQRRPAAMLPCTPARALQQLLQCSSAPRSRFDYGTCVCMSGWAGCLYS